MTELSPNKQALLKIRELKQQLAAAETLVDERLDAELRQLGYK